MTLRIDNFSGIAPIVAPHKLGFTLAQVAKNVRLESGSLEAMNGNLFEQSLYRSNVETIAKYKPGSQAYWFEFDEQVDVVPSQIFGSSRSEMYWTDGIKPKRTTSSLATATAPYPSASYSLGVPAPDVELVVGAVTGDEPESDFEKETRVYACTYVTAEGYEGPPSLPAQRTLGVAQNCSVFYLPTSAPSNYNINRKRIYRGTSASTELHFVAELSLTTVNFTDTLDAASLGEALTTYDYDLPPNDLVGLTVLPNGVMAGFNQNQLCFCEPYMPYAWPTTYRLTTENDIVAIAAVGSGLLVATTGKPYIVIGSQPDSMQMQQIDSNQACVSKRSMVDIGESAIYAGPDGLVRGYAGGVQTIGGSLFSREQWQALNPSSIHAYYHDEKYIFFYDNGSTQGGYILDPRGERNALTELDFYATTGFNDLETDTLYLVINGSLYSFQHGTPLSYTWKSGQFRLSNLMPYSACRVVADSYPGQITLTFDGSPMTFTYQDDKPFRFLPNARARFIEVTLQGTNTVKEVLIGNDMESVYG